MGKKRAWLAALLSFIFPGLGQIYNGKWLRGIGMAIIFTLILMLYAAITVVTYLFLQQNGQEIYTVACCLGVLLPVVMELWAIYDAYKGAKKVNASLVTQMPTGQ